jgi:c-di-GMP-binding flagellar brake protein YcgR
MTGATIPAPLLGGDVSLVIPDREMLRARVDDIVDGGVDLAVLQSPVTRDHRSTSYVEFVGPAGLWRYVGRFVPLDRSAFTDPDGVRQVVRFTFAGPPQLMQRREFIRADHAAPVVMFDLRDPDAVAESGLTVNVSGGGLLVCGFTTIDVGDDLRADLWLEADGPRVLAECRVVRVTDDGRHGVQFTHISEADRDQLVEFAYGLDRARREMAISR